MPMGLHAPHLAAGRYVANSSPSLHLIIAHFITNFPLVNGFLHPKPDGNLYTFPLAKAAEAGILIDVFPRILTKSDGFDDMHKLKKIAQDMDRRLM